MDLELEDKRALITGASAGIGSAIARRLASEGCSLILLGRDLARLEAVRSELLRSHKCQIEIEAFDLGEIGSADRIACRFPDVDILVNNAGDDPSGSLEEIDEVRWRAAWDVKLFGYTNLCRNYYALMRSRGGGVIVNIIGVAHLIRDARYICGAMSTAAITALTQALGGSSMNDGIRVVGVGPGVTATPRVLRSPKLVAAYSQGRADQLGPLDIDKIAQSVGEGLGLSRSGRPEEIADLVAFVASPRASYMSGTVVYSDGGWART